MICAMLMPFNAVSYHFPENIDRNVWRQNADMLGDVKEHKN